MIKKRNPLSGLLLSIIPGLGQIYNGQVKKAFTFLTVDFIVPIVFGLSGVLENIGGLVALFVWSFLFIVYRMADGFLNARKLVDYQLKAYNKWYFYFGFAIALAVIRIFIDLPASTGIQTFRIPTPAMIPTIQRGDRVVASLNYYDRNPIQRGDIVVFNPPQGGVWAFRVIGLPNDSIEIKDGNVYLNNRLNEVTVEKEYMLDEQEVIQYMEQVNPTKTIKTLRNKDLLMPDTRTFAKIVIPENEYFLMGDNRDNALDSRFIGTVKNDDIVGRVIYSFFGDTADRFNIDFREN